MKNKDLNAVIDQVRRWQADEVLDQGQKESLDRIIRQLRKLARNDQPNRKELFSVIRQMSETLWKAFVKE